MRTVAFVPIKYRSTRLKDKNFLPFGNDNNKKPLLTFVFDTLLAANEIDDIYCYCSNPDVKKYLPDGITFMRRDAYLDGDKVSSNDLLYYFSRDVNADKYVLTHATNPLISSETIDKVVKAVDGINHDSAMTVEKIQDLIWIDGKPNFNPTDAPLTQDIKPIYRETYGAICLERRIIQEHRRVGYKPAFIEVSRIESIDINTEEDFHFAEVVYGYNH